MSVLDKPSYEVASEATHSLQNGTTELQNVFLIRKLIDLVPNPWQAARILKEAMATLLALPNYDAARLAKSQLSLIDAIKNDLRAQIPHGKSDFSTFGKRHMRAVKN